MDLQSLAMDLGRLEMDRDSSDLAVKAEQQKILDDMYAQRAEARRMMEQAEDQLRKSSERSAEDLRQREQRFAEMAAHKAAAQE